MSSGQYIIMGVPGTELDRATAQIIRDVQPGGFILFGRNIKSPAQLRQLVDDLRGEWNYRGAVISDDLDMGAIVGHYGVAESVTRAVEAGNDLVLLCHRPELIPEAAKALESISPARAAQAEKQVASFLAQLQPAHDFSVAAHAAIDAKIMQLRVDTLGAEQAAQRSADDGKRSPVETF